DTLGTTYQFSDTGTATSIEDRNGNLVQIQELGNGAFTETDTTGRTVLSSSGFGSSGNTLTVSGIANPYRLTWQPINYDFTTDWVLIQGSLFAGCDSASHPTGTWNVIRSITLPNNKQYAFDYHPQYGLISQITYPSGGWVKYTWTVNAQSA